MNVFDSQGSGATRTFDAQTYVVFVPEVPQEYFLATINGAPISFRAPLLDNNVYSAG